MSLKITGVDYDPRDFKKDPTVKYLVTNTLFSKEEWLEYHAAKQECIDNGQEWIEVRSKKHADMAKAFRDAHKRMNNL